MSTMELVPREAAAAVTMTREQIELLKDTICRGSTDDELRLFVEVCRRKNLDPFSRQIHPIKRWDADLRRNVMTFQTGIDGFRVIAERSGKYEGQEQPLWCGADGKWREAWLDKDPPKAAKVAVLRVGWPKPIVAVALYSEYVQKTKEGHANSMWAKMPANQLAKCFSADTEVLTDKGFQPFPAVTGRILQVTDRGIQPTSVRPFSQPYGGPMIRLDTDMLNFCVTPTHDMVTTLGKVEARGIYETTRYRPVWRIPMTIDGSIGDAPFSDEAIRLTAIVAADGHHNGYQRFNVSVSREHKVRTLRAMGADSERVQHSRGAIAVAECREIRSNFDKLMFTFDLGRVEGLIDGDRQLCIPLVLDLSRRQARLLIDTWIAFDGHTNKKTGVRRLYTSRIDHLAAIEVLACIAGYSVNVPRLRMSDISSTPNHCVTISEPEPIGIIRPIGPRPGLATTQSDGTVWCCTVPSGVIVVRRHGFSMLCGNCAEGLALRKAFPEELSGLYTDDEMGQADSPRPSASGQEGGSSESGSSSSDNPPPPQEPEEEQDKTLKETLMGFRRNLKDIDPKFEEIKKWFTEIGESQVFEATMAQHGLGPGGKRSLANAIKAYTALWHKGKEIMQQRATEEPQEPQG